MKYDQICLNAFKILCFAPIRHFLLDTMALNIPNRNAPNPVQISQQHENVIPKVDT